jgi:dipeptidyl aminopeptidase/acylaminoacyl peptidase
MWSSDGQWVAFQSDREGDMAIFWQRADGTAPAERLTRPQPGESHIPDGWSPDGRQFLFSVVKGGDESLWIWSVRDKSAMPFGDVHSVLPINAVFSPDGRWVAYQAGQVFNNAVYVQPYPTTGAKYQISKGLAHHPVWSRDGSELFYQPARTRPVVVHITTRPSFAFSDPAPLPMVWAEGGPTSIRNVDTAPDGKAVGVVPFDQSARPPQIQVVLNWFEELKRQVPTH